MSYFVIAILCLTILLVCGAAYQTLGMRADKRRFPPPGLLVDVAGARLHLYELGSGSPAVILESGISASSLNWRVVQLEVAKFVRVCSYDRAGLGWSDLSHRPCTASSLATQLHELLRRAEVPPPYILVGHSFGGLIAHSFANRYASETAGLVLVDPLDPAEWTPLTGEQRRIVKQGVNLSRRGALAARIGVVRLCLNLLLGGNRFVPQIASKAWSGRASEVTDRIAGQVRKMPPETWPLVAMHWKQPKCFEGMARHFECLVASVQEMARAEPVAVPATILSGKLNDHPTDPAAYAARISSQSKVIYAQQSGHWIQLDEPGLVVDAIRELVETAKRTNAAISR